MRRGTSNSNARGSSTDRRARRHWLLKTWASNVDGHVRCFRCGTLLTEASLTVDRIVPGRDGGTYARENIRPACARCNSSLGGHLAHAEAA